MIHHRCLGFENELVQEIRFEQQRGWFSLLPLARDSIIDKAVMLPNYQLPDGKCIGHLRGKQIILCPKWGIWLAFLVIFVSSAVALGREVIAASDSEYIVRTWEAGDGMPDYSATSIAQAPDGYLWIGTFSGLLRFNGAEFTVFDSSNTPELPNDSVVNLHIDKTGRLFASTYRGLVVREGTRWRQIRRPDGSTSDLVRTFSERANGDLLITTFNGGVYQWSGGNLSPLPSPPGEAGQGYLGAVDEEGNWWVAQNKFVGRFEGGQWVSKVVLPVVPRDSMGLGLARDGGLWLVLGAEVRRLSKGTEVSKLTLPQMPGGVWSVSEDSKGNIWISTYRSGFCRVSPNGTMSRSSAAEKWSDNGRFVFEDREGNLWAGTSGDGLLHLVPRKFQHLELTAGRKGVVVHSVTIDAKGGAWAGTYGDGLFQIAGNNLTSAARIELTNDTRYLQSVLADQAGRLWVGTFNRGLRLLTADGIENIPLPPSVGSNVTVLFEDSRAGIWIGGGAEAVCRFDGQTFKVFGPDEGWKKGFVNSLAEDASGFIWGTSELGVFRQRGDRLFEEVKDQQGRSITGINCLKGDVGGAMWMGSRNRGLLRWKEGQTKEINADHGLSAESVYGIVEDNDGWLWIMSVRKILRARIEDLNAAADGRVDRIKCHAFDANDGLPKADFTGGRQPNCARDAHGRLWFATGKGVATIDPAKLQLNEKVPPLCVEAVSFHEQNVARAGSAPDRRQREESRTNLKGPFVGPVLIPAGSSRIEIHYACLSFAAPEKVQYQVKLEGQDEEWHEVGARRVAYFLQLAPRDYVFRVRGANNDGTWNETGASLAFTVLPFYWQTLWFRLLMAFTLVGVGAAAVWWWSRGKVMRALEHQKTARQIRELAGRLIDAQEKERTRLARELHDDITQRLACLAIDVGRCEQGTTQGSPAETAREVRAGLVRLSEDVHALSYRLHPSILEDLGLAEALKAEIDRFRQQHPMEVKLNLSDLPDRIPGDPALCLFRVAQEALRNLGRHSGASCAEVSLRTVDKGLHLAVQDNGRGFDPASERRSPSLGLSSMNERVLLLGGEFEIESAPGQGTTVLAWVPLKEINN